MAKSRWGRVDTVMRWTHLYAGLFLAPWLLIYATSGLFLNHQQWLAHRLKIAVPNWEVVREVKFTPNGSFPHAPAEQAVAILRHLDLLGAHRILGQPGAQPMVIHRISGAGHYRITWRRGQSLLIVERQPFSWYRLLHFLHFRQGYGQPYFAFVAWATLVDAVTVSLWLWVVTGIYIGLRSPRRRLIGSLCVLGGSCLFIVLTILLCL